jgi:hypothetical protein
MEKDNMSNTLDDFDGIFSDDDSSDLRMERAKQSIDTLLESTMVKSIRSSGRSVERVNSEFDNTKSDKMVKIKAGGIVKRDDGSETKDSMLALLEPDINDYGEIELSERKLERLKKQIKTASIGPISAVAMICTGSKCQVKEMCPYWKNDVAPLGEECLLEKNLIREWIERYMIEFNVDHTKTTEVQLVSELAEIAVYERRINSYISINTPMLLVETVSGIDQMGNPFYNIDIAKAFEIKDRLKKQRMKILDAMLATRDRKAKIVVAAVNASTGLKELSSLKQKLNELAKTRQGTVIDG